MGKIVGPLNTAECREFTHVAVFDFEDIAANATSSNQVTIASIPAGGALELCMVDESVALAGATDITVDVGTTAGDPDEFINALDIDAMTVPVFNTGDAFGSPEAVAGATAADAPVLVEFNGTVANLTAGKVVIGLRILDPRRFAALV
tara:strand:- start:4286 stop:4729 length:444 start_codon:yes stop_codon:yes gene_type:complete